MQEDIHNALVEFQQWLNDTQLDPADEADVETGETVTTLEDVNDLLEYNQRYSPSFSEVGWTKTAGNHKAALAKLKMYQSIMESQQPLTKSEERELENVMSQLRFFRQSYEISNWSKKTGAKLQIVTRYNIRPEWKDKILFFDIAKAEKTGRYDDPGNYKYADELPDNPNRNELFEDIKLLIVDAKGDPILVDGKLAYTGMNSSSEYNSEGVLKGDPAKDLDADGNLRPEVIAAQESFINERNKILSENGERFFYITGKSKGMPISQGEHYGEIKSSVMGRLHVNKGGRTYVIEKEEELKDLRLEMALPAKGGKGADQKLILY